MKTAIDYNESMDTIQTERCCGTCVHARPFGGENDNRCDAWECEYIDYREAIKAWEQMNRRESNELV